MMKTKSVEFVFLSEKGGRENNEDAYGNFEDKFFVVADGLGGLPAGEVAARLAIRTAISSFKKDQDIKISFEQANKKVFRQSRRRSELAGMGTTLVGVVVHSNEVAVANVGDSRVYIFRKGELNQLTRDHRDFMRALKRAIGIWSEVEVDIFEGKLKSGDLILLCTDGLTDFVGDGVIGKILASKANLKEKAQGLVESSLQFGSTDNITVGLIKTKA